jgi:hypothetical protein
MSNWRKGKQKAWRNKRIMNNGKQTTERIAEGK